MRVKRVVTLCQNEQRDRLASRGTLHGPQPTPQTKTELVSLENDVTMSLHPFTQDVILHLATESLAPPVSRDLADSVGAPSRLFQEFVPVGVWSHPFHIAKTEAVVEGALARIPVNRQRQGLRILGVWTLSVASLFLVDLGEEATEAAEESIYNPQVSWSLFRLLRMSGRHHFSRLPIHKVDTLCPAPLLEHIIELPRPTAPGRLSLPTFRV